MPRVYSSSVGGRRLTDPIRGKHGGIDEDVGARALTPAERILHAIREDRCVVCDRKMKEGSGICAACAKDIEDLPEEE